LWIQPVITRNAGGPHWMNGMSFSIDPPVDPKPLTVMRKPQQGDEQPVRLKMTARMKLEGAKSETRHLSMETRLHEKTTAVGPAGATLVLGVDKITLFGERGLIPILSDLQKQATTTDIGKAALVVQVDPRGTVGRREINLSNVPAETRDLVKELGEEVLHSFDVAAIPLPNGEAQPGQTWQAKRSIPTPFWNVRAIGLMDVNYTFLGTRQRHGREVGVLEMKGSFVRDNGESEFHVRGRTLFDPKLNLVVLATADVEMRTTSKTMDGSTALASGTLEVRLARGPEAEK
jgi:hypothetical protein